MQHFSNPVIATNGDKIFKGFYHIGTVTILAIFHSPNLRTLHMEFEQNGSVASEEKSFEYVNRRMQGWTDEQMDKKWSL